MTIYRRFTVLLILLTTVIILLIRHGVTTNDGPNKHNGFSQKGSGGANKNPGWSRQSFYTQNDGNQLPDTSSMKEPRDWTFFHPALPNSSLTSNELSRFRHGTPKPPGTIYTKAVVTGRLSSENTTWLENANLPFTISKFIYSLDKSPSSSLSDSIIPLSNPKGHEAGPYLTYLTTQYHTLPDISIFIHPHQYAWHTNEVLNHDNLEIITRLSAEHVIRQGYMNLRCSWKPGCPEYIHPTKPTSNNMIIDPDKPEEQAIAQAWHLLFPDDPLPSVLATPCCAQFAVSKQRIQEIPLHRFQALKEWLDTSELSDYISGRVFEYIWHKIFTGRAVQCPDMRVCYCDGFGVCFEDDVLFDRWFELRWRRREAERKLKVWTHDVERLKGERGKWGLKQQQQQEYLEEVGGKVPAKDGDVVLQNEIDRLAVELEWRRLRAIQAGTDPRVRARVAGRVWDEGDGY